MRRVWQDYGLTMTLAALFLGSWACQGVFQWFELVGEAHQHGQQLETIDYLHAFLRATFENWQSEFLQLFSFVVLSAKLIHRGSPQSKDGDDAMQAQLDAMEAKLDRLLARRGKA